MKTKILVVDDQPGTRRLLRNLLEREGFSVVEAEDEPSAWQVMHEEPEGVSLALIDVDLPGLGGRFVADHIQMIHPLRVLFMSGHDPAALRADGHVPADAPLLCKPFTLSEVRGAVTKELGPGGLPAAAPDREPVELLLHA